MIERSEEGNRVQKVDIPWGAWYRTDPLTISFPDDWSVESADMRGAPAAGREELQAALMDPVGSDRIRDLARGRRTAAIAVDDLTRPTRAAEILPLVLEELAEGGITEDRVVIVMALGSHRALTREDMVKKLGADIIQRVRVYNHCPFDNLLPAGRSDQGTPIFVNRYFMEADLKIAVGFVVPHPGAGWGGGGKIVVPGVCGIETLASFHGSPERNATTAVTKLDGNRLRDDVEDIARKVGLDFIVNAVGTSNGETAELYAGEPYQAHRAAVAAAHRIYATEAPINADVGIFNAYPEDSEFIQSLKALNVWADPDVPLVRPGGTIVVATAASEGRGTHYLMDQGMRLAPQTGSTHPALKKQIDGRTLAIFSPNVAEHDVADRYPPGTLCWKNWEEALAGLTARHGTGTHVVIFPCCSLQYLVGQNSKG
jgi:nickel-dependent lactate racemase